MVMVSNKNIDMVTTICSKAQMSIKRNRRQDDWGHGITAKDGDNPCFECGEMTSGRHHVVPVFRGGTKQLPLCAICHSNAEGINGVGFRPDLIKEALKKRRDAGLSLGRPGIDITKQARQLRVEGLSYKTIAGLLGVSVGKVFNTLNK